MIAVKDRIIDNLLLNVGIDMDRMIINSWELFRESEIEYPPGTFEKPYGLDICNEFLKLFGSNSVKISKVFVLPPAGSADLQYR